MGIVLNVRQKVTREDWSFPTLTGYIISTDNSQLQLNAKIYVNHLKLKLASKQYYQHRGRVVNTLTSYSGCPGFISRPGYPD
jgi:hypothetical protein